MIAERAQGRSFQGMFNGAPPIRAEDKASLTWSKGLLRSIGDKL